MIFFSHIDQIDLLEMKGHGLICFILMSVLYDVEVSTTTVTIHGVGSLRDTGSVQCGSKVSFICSIPTYKYNMVWLIDSVKVAECTTTNCVQYPPYKVDNIEFSHSTSIGEFNMTINPVTLKADGRKIKCSYGSESDQLQLAVKVFPTQNTTEIVESKDDNGQMIKITAMTGCVFPSSAIKMQWYYFEEDHIPKWYQMNSPTDVSNLSVCISGSCGGNSVVKIFSTLTILPEEQNGKEYFFQISIRHKDTGDIILVNSTRSYKINELSLEINQEPSRQVDGIEQRKVVSLVTAVIVVMGVLVVLGFIGLIAVMVVVINLRGQKRTNDQQLNKASVDKLMGDCDKTNGKNDE